MTAVPTQLIEQANTFCQDSRFKATLLRHFHAPVLSDDLNLAIHPDDQMLLHSLQHHQNASVALSQYFGIAFQQFYAAQQILSAHVDLSDPSLRVMDFACGYGRLLRLLTLVLPKQCIVASEVQPQALSYVTKAFGIEGVLSDVDPNRFSVSKPFDFIWVASLFSHLPDHLFHAWLQKLVSILGPKGVLCFSVRSSELMLPGDELNDEGFMYRRDSEITTLDDGVYGTTYANENYVKEAIERVLGAGHSYLRLPRALANEQDLYIVSKSPSKRLMPTGDFKKGAWGWVDKLVLTESGHLDIQGWAACMDKNPLRSVEIRIDGQTHSVHPSIAREDVVLAFENPGLIDSGWAFQAELGCGKPAPYIEVSACTDQKQQALLFAGTP